MRSLWVWISIAHALHLPVPFPDLDGECRGLPIVSLVQGHAWHVLIIGVQPNDDIDRGPLRAPHHPRTDEPIPTPWGDVAVVTHAGLDPAAIVASPTPFLDSPDGHALTFMRAMPHRRQHPGDGNCASPTARTACVRFCSWQI